jgi:DNA-binding GntR family transcriptional regulator
MGTDFRRHQTKTQLAVGVLRERIRNGELAPGDRLRPEEFAQELEMSPTPIREALRLLEADGLVDYQPHVGIVVARYSPEEIETIYRIRLTLEPIATELAVPALTGTLLEDLERRHEALIKATERRAPELSAANVAWHWGIYNAAQSALLADFIRRLWERSPLRTFWILADGTYAGDAAAAEHSEIMNSIRAGSADAAAALMHGHIARGQKLMLDHIKFVAEGGTGDPIWQVP